MGWGTCAMMGNKTVNQEEEKRAKIAQHCYVGVFIKGTTGTAQAYSFFSRITKIVALAFHLHPVQNKTPRI
jgi:hypothetical protein